MTTDSPRLKSARVVVRQRAFSARRHPETGAIAGTVIAGTVMDRSGVVVIATPEGGFRLSLLPPGNDSMVVEMVVEEKGFKQPTLRSVHVVASATAAVNVKLENVKLEKVKLEAGRDAVRIEGPGSAQLAEARSSALGWGTDQVWMADLPLAHRNFRQILADERFCGRV
jgi:hypothetical protein